MFRVGRLSGEGSSNTDGGAPDRLQPSNGAERARGRALASAGKRSGGVTPGQLPWLVLGVLALALALPALAASSGSCNAGNHVYLAGATDSMLFFPFLSLLTPTDLFVHADGAFANDTTAASYALFDSQVAAIATTALGSLSVNASICNAPGAPRACSLLVLPLWSSFAVPLLNTNGVSLALSLEALLDIHAGNITYWDDPRIASTNTPEAMTAVGHLRIFLVYCLTPTVIDILDGIAAEMGRNGSATWPKTRPFTFVASSEVEAGRTVLATPGAIGVIGSETFATAYNSAATAQLLDRGGNAVRLSETSAALATAQLDTVATATAYARDPLSSIDLAWPLSTLSWIAIPSVAPRSTLCCPQLSLLATALGFELSSPLADSMMWSYGHKPLASLLKDSVLTQLRSLTCDRVPILYEPRLIAGAGATLPEDLYTVWRALYQAREPDYTITYLGIGSTGGKAASIAGTVIYSGSDAVISATERATLPNGPELDMFPATAAAIAVVHSMLLTTGGHATVALSRTVLARIFLGQISRWNDPAILALNPELAAFFPNASIAVVVRLDSSGVTEIFTDALSQFSTAFATEVGKASSPRWPTVLGSRLIRQTGNSGIANYVASNPNTIAYVALSYQLQLGLAAVALLNSAGAPVLASLETAQLAIDYFAALNGTGVGAPPVAWLPFYGSRVNCPVPESWPIVGYSYFVLPKRSYGSCNLRKAFLDYYIWTQSSAAAAAIAKQKGYLLVSPSLFARVLRSLGQLSCDGQLLLTTCDPGYQFSLDDNDCRPCGNGSYSSAVTKYNCVACPRGQFAGQAERECSACGADTFADALGSANCTPCNALATTNGAHGATNATGCFCASGAFAPELVVGQPLPPANLTARGLVCVACPPHSTCAGGRSLPQTQPGYWADARTPWIVQSCWPAQVCIGGSKCAKGQEGSRCATCSKGYFLKGQLCAPCPQNAGLRLVFTSLALLALILIPLLIPHHRLMTAQVPAVVSSFCQIGSSMAQIRVLWPSRLQTGMSLLSPLQWMSIFSPPQCSLLVGFFFNWTFRVLLPLACIIWAFVGAVSLLVLNVFLRMFLKCCGHRLGSIDRNSDAYRRSLLMRMYYHTTLRRLVCSLGPLCSAWFINFFSLFSSAAVEFFNCVRSYDGKYYLVADTTIQCYHGEWMRWLPFGIVVLLLHMVCLPLGVCVVLWYARRESTRLSIVFQVFFGYVYMRYKPSLFFWELVVFARKIITFLCILLLFNSPVTACVLVLLVQVGMLVVHRACEPFLMPGVNYLEELLIVATIILAASGMLFVHHEAGRNGWSGAMVALLVICIASSLAFFILELVRSRNFSRKFRWILLSPWLRIRPVTIVVDYQATPPPPEPRSLNDSGERGLARPQRSSESTPRGVLALQGTPRAPFGTRKTSQSDSGAIVLDTMGYTAPSGYSARRQSRASRRPSLVAVAEANLSHMHSLENEFKARSRVVQVIEAPQEAGRPVFTETDASAPAHGGHANSHSHAHSNGSSSAPASRPPSLHIKAADVAAMPLLLRASADIVPRPGTIPTSSSYSSSSSSDSYERESSSAEERRRRLAEMLQPSPLSDAATRGGAANAAGDRHNQYRLSSSSSL